MWFSLHDVQNLMVIPAKQYWKQLYAAAGHTTWDVRIDPPIYLVLAQRTGSQRNGFFFGDEGMANRVAKAMIHAVELCGGGNKR
jgi:hypothetical protein